MRNTYSAGGDDCQPPAQACSQGQTWVVYRQDDHGNRFIVSTRLGREEAERLVAEFEARGHKQVYWMEPEPT